MVLLELSLYAHKLQNVAGLGKGKSDPFAVVTKIATQHGQKPEVLGKTETIKNTLNPEWNKVFVFEYELGTPVRCAISLFDHVRKSDNKSMGSAIFDIGELLGARGGTKAKKVKGGGMLYAHIRKSQGSGVLRLTMKGEKLKNTEGFMRKSDPFFEISRRVDAAGAATWDNVFQSNVIKDDLNPSWQEAPIQISILCGGKLDLPLLVKVFDFESSGKHELMGQFETSVQALVAATQRNAPIELVKKGKPTGTIHVVKADVSGTSPSSSSSAPATSPTPASISSGVSNMSVSNKQTQPADFVDYISGGCELNVVVAVDFTGSNGDPRKPGTLHHFRQDGGPNDYQKAIKSILTVLAKYDHDKKFPVLGFGAKYDGVVRHAFQCGPAPEAQGVDGVLDAYSAVFRSGLIMSGPTDFTEVIKTAATRATSNLNEAQRTGKQSYTVLVILSDGCVSDIQSTAACLEQVHDSPLSIVIVGVGNADFSGMNFLDDLSKPGKRDIVQFVPFNQHSHSSADLSSATLHEIPHQLTGFFQSKGIQPGTAIRATEAEIVVEEEEEIDLSLNIGDDDEIVVSGGGNDFRGW